MATLPEAFALHARQEKELKYGTAGFRDRADLPLHSMFVRMGVLAVLRSRSVGGRAIGVMITASHNEECDNGVKLVDSDGGMLASEWEPHAETLANAASLADFESAVLGLTAEVAGGVIVIGRDTRPHSSEFRDCVSMGASAMGGRVIDLGEVTTPQLHFVIQRANQHDLAHFEVAAALEDYYRSLAAGYFELLDSVDDEPSGKQTCPDSIIIDASCGIGGVAVLKMAQVMTDMTTSGSTRLEVDLRNNAGSGPVNAGCGAELVQKQVVPPKGVDALRDLGKLMCSFDGDADRIVFHSFREGGAWKLIDGDKIAALMSVMLIQELRAAGLDAQVSLGVVQTAYANGASTNYLRQQGVAIAMAKTGVKYLHHVAQSFDLGIYFEANGHGTVLISDKFHSLVATSSSSSGVGGGGASERSALAILRLKAFCKAINQAVGDAISDMLVCLASLRILSMDTQTWIDLFTDLPSKQLKIPVANKAVIVCSEDETFVVEPQALAADLQRAMADIPCGRCFVRPSGTEDVVRVYAEAATAEQANLLADRAREAVLSYCQ